MPTNKPRVHWVLPAEVVESMQIIADAHTRSLRLEATVALQRYIEQIRIEEPELFDQNDSD